MADASLPPWLNINPLAGVPMFLQGYGQGAAVGEAQRRAEQSAYEAEVRAQAEQERNAILREAKQIQAQEFAQNLQLKQQEAERAARTAAIQLEGQQGLERGMADRIARGETPEQAFRSELPIHASKLFYQHPQGLAQVLSGTQTKEYAPSELEKSMQFLLQNKYIEPGQAGALAIGKFLGPSMRLKTPEGLEIEYGRQGPTKEPSTPTTAFQTQLQQKLHSYDNSMALLDHIEKNMNASDFGLRGMAKELKSRIGGQFGLNVPPEQLDVRNSLKQLRQDLYKALRSDSNIPKSEQEQILRMLPEVETFDVAESLPNAVGKLLTVKRTLYNQSRTAAARLGVLPPLWSLSNDEIASAVKLKQSDPKNPMGLDYNEALRFLVENRE